MISARDLLLGRTGSLDVSGTGKWERGGHPLVFKKTGGKKGKVGGGRDLLPSTRGPTPSLSLLASSLYPRKMVTVFALRFFSFPLFPPALY